VENDLLASFFCELSAFGTALRFEKNSFLTNDAGMSLETKERCGKLEGEAGMYLKTKAVSSIRRECC
jgi:hypothetical protein